MTFEMHRISLEKGEFVCGRRKCSEDTGLSEQNIRTSINQLTNQQMLQKVTNKSTNKYSIYRWSWEDFPCQSNQQVNIKATNKTQMTNHILELKNKNIESKQAEEEQPITKLPACSLNFEKETTEKLSKISSEEQNQILNLLQIRHNKNPIANPDGWIIECLKNSWHKKEPPKEPQKINYREINYEFAKELLQSLESINGIKSNLRKDFLELGKTNGHCWQIFFHETPSAFKAQLESAMRKMGVNAKKY